MKRMMVILAMMVTIVASASAMSYQQARREALFLADKMAYELQLSDAQYEAAYEANLDYLMSLDSRGRVYGSAWSNRNALLRVVLAPWQYAAFSAADYFFRPVYWVSNTWRWRIYDRYDRSRFFRTYPRAFNDYRGGRSIDYYRGRNWYQPARPNNWNRGNSYNDRDYRYYDRGRVSKEREKAIKQAEKDRRNYEKEMRKSERRFGYR